MNSTRYNPISMALHWLLALLILGSLAVGLYMTGLPFSPTRLRLYNWHKWAGVVILILCFFQGRHLFVMRTLSETIALEY